LVHLEAVFEQSELVLEQLHLLLLLLEVAGPLLEHGKFVVQLEDLPREVFPFILKSLEFLHLL
jgi:hypothetical protein